MLEKICIDCAECTKAKGILVCHEMFDRPIAELDECPFGIESEEIEEIEQKAKAVKIKHGAKADGEKPKVTKKKVVSDEKSALFTEIWDEILEKHGDSAQILNENKLIAVKIGARWFKIDIIQSKKALF